MSRLQTPEKTPAQADGSTVYPVHMLDDTKGCRAYMVSQTFRFDDVLDAEKLRGSLTRLLEIGDWKKLAGRLRFNASTRPECLERHVSLERKY